MKLSTVAKFALLTTVVAVAGRVAHQYLTGRTSTETSETDVVDVATPEAPVVETTVEVAEVVITEVPTPVEGESNVTA